jgi:dTDP-4-amino-4,6-dideoxygalactose transaminase
MPKLALLGGKPLCKQQPPKALFPDFNKKAISAVVNRLKEHRQVDLCGHIVAESLIRDYHSGGYPLLVSSGTAALQVALAALGIGPGDEVITSPYSWGATTACILHLGAIPKFTDVVRETGLMDPDTIEKLITKKTKAILPVHIYGQAADMTGICAVARKHSLFVVEDGSQAHGALWARKKVGLFGDAGGFSCMGGKLLASTEAGYVIFRNRQNYNAALTLCQHTARSKESGFPKNWLTYWDSLFYSFRVCMLAADILAEQILKLDRELQIRRANVNDLRHRLEGSEFLSFPKYQKGNEPSYHMVTANFDAEGAGIKRDTFTKAVSAEGFNMWHYIPSPIPSWHRINWQGYNGPPTPWLRWLKKARTDYRGLRFPNCEWKISHAIEFGMDYLQRETKRVQCFADCVLKVEENIDSLRKWEKRRKK